MDGEKVKWRYKKKGRESVRERERKRLRKSEYKNGIYYKTRTKPMVTYVCEKEYLCESFTNGQKKNHLKRLTTKMVSAHRNKNINDKYSSLRHL